MAPVPRSPSAVKFAATDAARLALTTPPRPHSLPRARVARAALVLWCRDLQFPTMRGIVAVSGHRTPSAVSSLYGSSIEVQAAIVRSEWERVVESWLPLPASQRAVWLAEHARQLASVDPACLRLPGLVCAAVAGSGADELPPPDLLAPLYGLAALAPVARKGRKVDVAWLLRPPSPPGLHAVPA